jgi:hypothetical protein
MSSDENVTLNVPAFGKSGATDLISGESFPAGKIRLPPFGVLWLEVS